MTIFMMLLDETVVGVIEALYDGKGGWDQAMPEGGKGGWVQTEGKAGW
jgi:hypothetical protein